MPYAIKFITLMLAALLFAPASFAADQQTKGDERSLGTKIRDKFESLSGKLSGEDKMERDPVKAAQRALNAKGYDAGEPDGKLGRKTHAAVRAFQKDEGLKVTGRLDPETMERLRAGKQESRPSASPRTEGERSKPGPGASTTTPDAELGKSAKDTKRK
jgi:peptidoglycan hydrolase-like protein with peptidoglycan-binding domain